MASVSMAGAAGVEPPRVLDGGWKIELVASEPELVTPTGCCFDDAGRLIVIECHTHFPPEDYSGPKEDRIYAFSDGDGNGSLERKSLFYRGGVASMGIANCGEGWIAVATRSEVRRLRDSDGDGQAEQSERLLALETEANYPHNGLASVAMGPDGWMYVGLGENFGEPYKLVAADGSMQVGGGEGGNIFRCRTDGSQLERIATGFWNPFGTCFDHSGRMWMVGNDPDSMPPNRLLHIVPTGDYGFQFRFGRAGIHPLQAWNGELPGTLPMVAGVGEAACGVVPHRGRLWVTSWGDNRIERHRPVQRGASWTTESETIVQGDANFRPVGMAVADDGSIYVTDWVDRSYEVHRQGRLWRLSPTSDATADSLLPPQTQAEALALDLRRGDLRKEDRLTALENADPFIRQAAIAGLVSSGQLAEVSKDDASTPLRKVGLLTAWRWSELSDPQSVSTEQRENWIEWGLQDRAEEVVIAAVRWAAERNANNQIDTIRELLSRKSLSPRLFNASISAVAYLETGSASGKARDPATEKMLVEFAGDVIKPAALRALAILKLPPESELPSDEQLKSYALEGDRQLAFEAVRLLAARGKPASFDALGDVVASTAVDPQVRADALAALPPNSPLIARLALDRNSAVAGTPLALEVQRIGDRSGEALAHDAKPPATDLDAWFKTVGQGGDAAAGRRVFARTTCMNCHTHADRGAKTGPDLTTLADRMDRRRVMESILLPSREVGPLYVPWRVLTVDGEVLTGLKLDRPGIGNSMQFQAADGKMFEVPLVDVEQQEQVEQSIMPAGLEQTMTVDELRDLLAFLTAGR